MAEATNIYTVLSKCQKEFPGLKKTATAKMGTFTFDYAPLEEVIGAALPVLNKNGIFVSQDMDGGDLVTRLHYGAQTHESRMTLPQARDLKDFGGTITYARRYSLAATLCLAADQDMDVQGNENAPAPPQRPKAPPAEWKLDAEGNLSLACGGSSGQETQKALFIFCRGILTGMTQSQREKFWSLNEAVVKDVLPESGVEALEKIGA